MARVLRPGGVLAAIWNDRDKATGWVAQLARLIATGRRARPEERALLVGTLRLVAFGGLPRVASGF